MRNPQDNMVYVVSLSHKPIKQNSHYTWIDAVEKDECYFHPLKKGWPDVPPNYIAFRYDGQLQSVHYIESYQVVDDLSAINESWPEKDADSDPDHLLYKLGPAMRPPYTVRSGPIWNRRIRCAIDTLLSGAYENISEAKKETIRRLDGINN